MEEPRRTEPVGYMEGEKRTKSHILKDDSKKGGREGEKVTEEDVNSSLTFKYLYVNCLQVGSYRHPVYLRDYRQTPGTRGLTLPSAPFIF